MPKTAPTIHWQPNPGPQELLISCPAFIEDVGTGGSRGGGKTQGMLGDFLVHEKEDGKQARGLFIRKTYDELAEVIRQADEIFEPLGVKGIGNPRRNYKWPSGAVLKMRALQRDADADKYQGHAYTRIYCDEVTNFASLSPLDKLRACLRSGEAKIAKKFVSSANPGGPGHNAYKARYIDPSAPLVPYFDEVMQCWRVFIPSTLDDNPQLLENDPDYWKRVVASANGREDLIKAWRWGHWDIVAGGMYDDVWNRKIHVMEPFRIPHSWRINRSFDWGSSKPYSVGFWAESDGTTAPNGRTYPKGTLFRIAEIYGWNKKPNEGLKKIDTDIAKEILKFEATIGYTGRVEPGPADSSIYDADNGVCIADNMAKLGVRWTKADKSPGSIKSGCEAIRRRLSASMKHPMEEPGLFVFANCTDGFIRTLPVLPRDKDNPDVPDPNAEDHCPDEVRYRCLQVRHSGGTVRLGGL
jgi:hypothetical protein